MKILIKRGYDVVNEIKTNIESNKTKEVVNIKPVENKLRVYVNTGFNKPVFTENKQYKGKKYNNNNKNKKYDISNVEKQFNVEDKKSNKFEEPEHKIEVDINNFKEEEKHEPEIEVKVTTEDEIKDVESVVDEIKEPVKNEIKSEHEEEQQDCYDDIQLLEKFGLSVSEFNDEDYGGIEKIKKNNKLKEF